MTGTCNMTRGQPTCFQHVIPHSEQWSFVSCICVMLSCKGNQDDKFHNSLIALLVLKRTLDPLCKQAIWHGIGGHSSTGDQAAPKALTAVSHKTTVVHLKHSSRLLRSFSELEGERGKGLRACTCVLQHAVDCCTSSSS